jgi:hypothetical protein
MHTVRFLPDDNTQRSFFGFLGPNAVIHMVHLIPVYDVGCARNLLQMPSIADQSHYYDLTCIITCMPWFCPTFFWLNILHSVPWHMGYHWDHFHLLACTSFPCALFQPHDLCMYLNSFSHVPQPSAWYDISISTSSISGVPRIAAIRSGASHYVYKPCIRHTWTLGLSAWITSFHTVTVQGLHSSPNDLPIPPILSTYHWGFPNWSLCVTLQ